MATKRAPGGATPCKDAALRLDSVGILGENQPHATYVFDIRVANPADGPRWLVFPDTFPREGREAPAPGRGTIDALRATRLAGRGRLVSVHATGPGGFRAVFLPAGAKAVLNELPIFADWTMTHATAKIDIIVAREVLVDDAPLTSWIRGSLLAENDTDVSFASDPITRLVLAKPFASGAHTVTIQDDCRTTAQAILVHREP